MTIDSRIVLPIDALTATTPKALRAQILTQLATMSSKVPGKLRQNKRRYKHYFDPNFWTMPKFSFGQFVYVDSPPLVTLPTDSNSDQYKKVLPGAYG